MPPSTSWAKAHVEANWSSIYTSPHNNRYIYGCIPGFAQSITSYSLLSSFAKNSTRKALFMKVCLKDLHFPKWFNNNDNNPIKILLESLSFSLKSILSKEIQGEIFFLVSLLEIITNVNIYWGYQGPISLQSTLCILTHLIWDTSMIIYHNYLVSLVRNLKHKEIKKFVQICIASKL